MRHFAVSVIGRDRPGIVAGVTAALLDHGVNIEDSQSTILRGHFTMTLIVSVGEEVDLSRLRTDLERAGSELRLEAVTLSEIEDAEPASPVEPSHIVTVYGVDHPGIVHAVASALAGCGVNIVDLNTRLVGDPDHDDLYAMMLEVALPAGLGASGLESLLEATRREQGVDVTIRELEHDALQAQGAAVAVREVLRMPHPLLKRGCAELQPGDGDRARVVTADLLDTMHAHPGCVGLAAPQLGEMVRIVVVDVTGHPKASVVNGELVLVNPRVEHSRGAEVAREGCLSIPHLTANVRRALEVVVTASDPDGEPVRVSSAGFEARCLLHEMDHLDGILFLDRVDSLTTDVFRRKKYR